ncbi:MAG TPA: hypothetical protein VFQ26_02515, partial [Nitrospiraceae bacterium]|nr:hypothetical protein [Nitrospiraceae bacterium]
MNRTILAVILQIPFVWTAVARAAEPPTFSSAPPSMGEVQLIGDILVVSRGVPMMVAETHQGTRQVGDKEEAYDYVVKRTVIFPQSEAIAARDYRILDMEGRPVEQGLLAEKLGTTTPVLV